MTDNTAGRPLSAPAPEKWGGRFVVDAGDFTAIARLFLKYELHGVPFEQAQGWMLIDRGERLPDALWKWTDANVAERHWRYGRAAIRPFHPNSYRVREISTALSIVEPQIRTYADVRAFAKLVEQELVGPPGAWKTAPAFAAWRNPLGP